MYNTEALHASKRKQESSNFAAEPAVNDPFVTSELKSKRQRLNYEQHPMNAEQMHYNGNDTMVNGYGYVQTNGHSQTNDNHLGVAAAHLQDGEVTNGAERVSEPMECAEEQMNHKVEVNGNLTLTSNGKYCPHGHLNMCTTYNVPCRYPRMYCHPGNMLEDRLSIYHGI